MKFLGEVCLDPGVECDTFKLRRNVRVVLLDQKDRVAMLNITKEGWYQLPGGGIEDGETLVEALHRECLEEAGAQIEVLDELGVIIELWNSGGRMWINYHYLARIVGELVPPAMTQPEIDSGTTLEFHSLDDAIKILEKPHHKLDKTLMQTVELVALREYKRRRA